MNVLKVLPRELGIGQFPKNKKKSNLSPLTYVWS